MLKKSTWTTKLLQRKTYKRAQLRPFHDKLVMTTGSWPIIPPIPGIDAENILLCKNYSQANVIIEKAKDAKRVVVVGGVILVLN